MLHPDDFEEDEGNLDNRLEEEATQKEDKGRKSKQKTKKLSKISFGKKIKKISGVSASHFAPVRLSSTILRTVPANFPYLERESRRATKAENQCWVKGAKAQVTLPDELWTTIFRIVLSYYTDPRVGVAAMLTCRQWRSLCFDIVLKTSLGTQWILACEDWRLAKYRKRADYSAQAKVATDGGNYVGEWVTKWGRHGRGEFTKPKLGTYKGCWLFDKQHGWGLLTYKVDRYEGFWVNGVKHGRGKELDREGREYEGYFVNNLKCGRGILRYPDGSVYDGDWVDGLKTGHGFQKYEDGAEYDGDWANGKKHGKGVFVYASGSKYEGGWVDGHEEGWGILTRTNGERYEGEWLAGKRHGKGTLTKDGVSQTGRWYKGKLQNEKDS